MRVRLSDLEREADLAREESRTVKRQNEGLHQRLRQQEGQDASVLALKEVCFAFFPLFCYLS